MTCLSWLSFWQSACNGLRSIRIFGRLRSHLLDSCSTESPLQHFFPSAFGLSYVLRSSQRNTTPTLLPFGLLIILRSAIIREKSPLHLISPGLPEPPFHLISPSLHYFLAFCDHHHSSFTSSNSNNILARTLIPSSLRLLISSSLGSSRGIGRLKKRLIDTRGKMLRNRRERRSWSRIWMAFSFSICS